MKLGSYTVSVKTHIHSLRVINTKRVANFWLLFITMKYSGTSLNGHSQ